MNQGSICNDHLLNFVSINKTMLRYIKQYNSFVPSGTQLVQKVDYDIHWIHVNLCPVESTVIFPDTYSMDGGLSHG